MTVLTLVQPVMEELAIVCLVLMDINTMETMNVQFNVNSLVEPVMDLLSVLLVLLYTETGKRIVLVKMDFMKTKTNYVKNVNPPVKIVPL